MASFVFALKKKKKTIVYNDFFSIIDLYATQMKSNIPMMPLSVF